jgi:hypothetical protein
MTGRNTAPTVSDAELSQESVRLDHSDRAWMEGVFRCDWPEAEDEQAWLDHANELVELGSVSMRDFTHADFADRREAVVGARQAFFALFPTISKTTLMAARKYEVQTGDDVAVRPQVFIEAQRLMYARGLNGRDMINKQAGNITKSATQLARWMDGVDSLGIDSVAVLRKNEHLFTMSVGSIGERMQPMYAAARAAGIKDYRKAAIEFATSHSVLLHYKPDKIRTLTRILSITGIQIDSPGHLQDLAILPLYDTVVAYLEHGPVLRSTAGLLYHSYRNHKYREEVEVRAVIADYVDTDDRVIKAFLKGYPMDAEAARQVYARHLRARDRRQEHTLLWPGPALLGDPDKLSPVRAYMSVIESPELTPEQFRELSQYINEGEAADKEPRQQHIAHDDDEIAQKTRQVERGQRARTALVARHLGLVVDIAEGCLRTGDKAEIIAIGNVALTRFAQRDYVPQMLDEGDGLQQFRDQAAMAIMRSMISYAPRYQGRSLAEMEKMRPADDTDRQTNSA